MYFKISILIWHYYKVHFKIVLKWVNKQSRKCPLFHISYWILYICMYTFKNLYHFNICSALQLHNQYNYSSFSQMLLSLMHVLGLIMHLLWHIIKIISSSYCNHFWMMLWISLAFQPLSSNHLAPFWSSRPTFVPFMPWFTSVKMDTSDLINNQAIWRQVSFMQSCVPLRHIELICTN